MRENTWYAIGDLVLILLAVLLLSGGCNPTDPSNSMNAIYLEDPTGTPGRFRVVYINEVNGVMLRVFEDIKYPGNELIMISTRRGVGITYVQHNQER